VKIPNGQRQFIGWDSRSIKKGDNIAVPLGDRGKKVQLGL
jgi:hypothetical protein